MSETEYKGFLATHSSTLAWKVPWTEEPVRLQSMGSLGVERNWAASLSLFTFVHWRWKWQPTPVFLSGESQGRGSLVGCRLMGSHRVGQDWSDLAVAVTHFNKKLAYNKCLIPLSTWVCVYSKTPCLTVCGYSVHTFSQE